MNELEDSFCCYHITCLLDIFVNLTPMDFNQNSDISSVYAKSWLIGKDSDAGRDWGQEEKGMTEDEVAGWHHWLDGRQSEWTPGAGDGQEGLACCDSWGRKELDTTERLNWTMTLATALKLQQQGDFSGGPMVKILPCNGGDVGTIPCQRTKILHATTRESVCCNKRSYMMPQKCQLLQLRPDANSKY